MIYLTFCKYCDIVGILWARLSEHH